MTMATSASLSAVSGCSLPRTRVFHVQRHLDRHPGGGSSIADVILHIIFLEGSLSYILERTELISARASQLLRAEGQAMEVLTAGKQNQPGATVSERSVLNWVKNARMLHVVYSVGDLEKTVKFYTECLGMKLLRKRDLPEEGFANAFLGYGPEDSHFVVELTYNYGVDKYDIRTGFVHFGIAVEHVKKTIDLIKAKGGKVIQESGFVKGYNVVVAAIEDPDGCKFELIERGLSPEPLCQVMLRVFVGNVDFLKELE